MFTPKIQSRRNAPSVVTVVHNGMPTSQLKLVGGSPKFSRARSMERSHPYESSRLERVTPHVAVVGTLHYQGKMLGSDGNPAPCIKPYASVVYDPSTSKVVFLLKEKGPTGVPGAYGNRAQMRSALKVAEALQKHNRVWSKLAGKHIYRKQIDEEEVSE